MKKKSWKVSVGTSVEDPGINLGWLGLLDESQKKKILDEFQEGLLGVAWEIPILGRQSKEIPVETPGEIWKGISGLILERTLEKIPGITRNPCRYPNQNISSKSKWNRMICQASICGQDTINYVKEAVLLGFLFIQQNLEWNSHVNSQCNKLYMGLRQFRITSSMLN